MSAYRNVVSITDLIPFGKTYIINYQHFKYIMNFILPLVSQLKEMFFNWLTLDDNDRCRLKYIVEQNENKEIKPMVLALEQWDYFQNYGMPEQLTIVIL